MLFADKLITILSDDSQWKNAPLKQEGDLLFSTKGIARQLDTSLKFAMNDNAINACLRLAESFGDNPWGDLIHIFKLPAPLCWYELESDMGVLLADRGDTTACLYMSSSADIMIGREFSIDPVNSEIGVTDGLSERDRKGLHGTAGLCILFTALLNCKNLRTETVRLPEYKQAARKAKGKLPLYEYKILNLDLNKVQERQVQEGLCSRTEARLHLVRGHFKKRKSGLYWWAPFLRGSLEIGVLDKEYKA